MEQPNYYAILTADVRYNKDLSPMAKLLFAEITALTQKEGFCWASNPYFAELYGVHKSTVSGWVKELRDAGYITVEITDNTYRKIWTKGVSQNTIPYSEKAKGGIRKGEGGYSEKANITLQDNNKNNISGSGSYERPAAKKEDPRGKPSPAKERIREMIKSGKLGELKNA